jgi:hypothetical protein
MNSPLMNPQTLKMIVVAWVCMFTVICIAVFFIVSHNRSDKAWCRAHKLTVHVQEHPPQVFCQDVYGIRKRPGEYPVENSVWVIERPTRNGT